MNCDLCRCFHLTFFSVRIGLHSYLYLYIGCITYILILVIRIYFDACKINKKEYFFSSYQIRFEVEIWFMCAYHSILFIAKCCSNSACVRRRMFFVLHHKISRCLALNPVAVCTKTTKSHSQHIKKGWQRFRIIFLCCCYCVNVKWFTTNIIKHRHSFIGNCKKQQHHQDKQHSPKTKHKKADDIDCAVQK